MVLRVQFLRGQAGGSAESQAVIKTYFFFAPDDLSEERALEMAKCEFCAWAGVADWTEVANGYELAHHDLAADGAPSPAGMSH